MRPRPPERRRAARPSRGSRAWVELSVLTSAEAAEAVSHMLFDLRPGGVVEEPSPGGGVLLRCYLPSSPLLPATLRTLRARIGRLRQVGLDPRPARVRSRRIASRRWATAWRAYVRPVRVGRLWIRPPWVQRPAPPGTTVVTIDPGMAFGTGMHPSTRLCLRALGRYLEAGDRVVDVGTGSGILAIAAARLAGARVWAVDCDPVAVAHARANVRANRVDRLVQVRRGWGLAAAPRPADLILANLTADALLSLLPDVPSVLAPAGHFVGSGFVEERLAEVIAAAEGARLAPVAVLAEGEWRAVVLARDGRRRRPA